MTVAISISVRYISEIRTGIAYLIWKQISFLGMHFTSRDEQSTEWLHDHAYFNMSRTRLPEAYKMKK
jgi:hypothetical protein